MPYSSLDEINPSLKGISPPISLAQANQIAKEADGIGENGWPIAISNFKKRHIVKDGHWVEKASFASQARPLIEDSVNEKLNLIIKKLFLGNRIMDRGMSVLDVEFLMNHTVSIIHPLIAHRFPLLADVVSDYQSDRNCLTIYLDTPTESTQYSSVPEFFDRMVEYQIELENLVYECCEFADENNDYYTKVFLDKFMLDLIPLTKQLLLLSDKSHAYENDCQSFDHRVEDWIILKPFGQ